MNKLAIIVLAAGKGTRMKSSLPKVLHKIAGLEMLGHVLNAARLLNPEKIIVVTSPDMPAVAGYVNKSYPEASIALQDKQLGTGHAVICAEKHLQGFAGIVVTLCGDSPLIDITEIQQLLTKITVSTPLAILAMDSEPSANSYGRLVTVNDSVERIVEVKDANSDELKIRLANSGIIACNADILFRILKNLGNNNVQGEYYLTDVVGIARSEGISCTYAVGDEANLQGINSRSQLAAAEKTWQQNRRIQAMADGATLVDADTVYFSFDTTIGRDVTIEPNVYFGSKVEIADNVTIKAFCHIDGAKIASGVIIGPFARLRPGTELGEDVHIGNFVETKNTRMKKGAKANHLTYIGDADIGAKANIGAGTITCNYDGFNKYKTEIGDGAFIGSNTSLVAPVKVGNGAITGAGSVISDDIPDNALALTRPTQTIKNDWAEKFRKRKGK